MLSVCLCRTITARGTRSPPAHSAKLARPAPPVKPNARNRLAAARPIRGRPEGGLRDRLWPSQAMDRPLLPSCRKPQEGFGSLGCFQERLNSASEETSIWVAHGFSRGGPSLAHRERESPAEFVSPTSEEVGHPSFANCPSILAGSLALQRKVVASGREPPSCAAQNADQVGALVDLPL